MTIRSAPVEVVGASPSYPPLLQPGRETPIQLHIHEEDEQRMHDERV